MLKSFNLEMQHSGLLCFTASSVPVEVMRLIKGVLTQQLVDSEGYELMRNSHPFLQGYNEDSGWILVEFWTESHKAVSDFVEYINKCIADLAI